MRAKIMFKIVGWDESPFDDPESGPKLTQAHVKRTFDGDLTGNGNLMYVMTHLSGENASFLGYEKVEGELHGRKGSLVLRHVGFYDGGTANSEMEVVPGSGTDELSGISGTARFSAGHAEEHDMPFEYEI